VLIAPIGAKRLPEKDDDINLSKSSSFQQLKKTLHAINSSLRFLIKTRDRQINKSALRIGMRHRPIGFAFRGTPHREHL
jgi:hypothetical protein